MKALTVALLVLVNVASAGAGGDEDRLAADWLIQSKMVIQRDRPFVAHGTAAADAHITVVMTSAGGATRSGRSRAGRDGAWSVSLEAMPAGGPYELTIESGDESLSFDDILVGEVWIASGQSNMGMRVSSAMNADEEIARASDPGLRLATIDLFTSIEPLDTPVSFEPWTEAAPGSVAGFSATAYYFARELRRELDVPVGVVLTAWGGTPAEAWTPMESLISSEVTRSYVDQWTEPAPRADGLDLQEVSPARNAAFRKLASNLTDAEAAIPAAIARGDATPGDYEWIELDAPRRWPNGRFDGVTWLTRVIDVPQAWAGEDLSLSLGTIFEYDIVFLNGEEIGATRPSDGGSRDPRVYTIPGELVEAGRSILAVRVTDVRGNGGFMGKRDELWIDPYGSAGERMSLAGTWNGAEVLSDDDAGIPTPNETPIRYRPAGLYNGMVHPLIGYAYAGVIWYQGESNRTRAEAYETLFPMLIEAWRERLDQPLPFYFVQIANYLERHPDPVESEWARVRESQRKTLRLERTGMATAIDIGEADDIHPKNKQDVGRRLSLLARRDLYGEAGLVAEGPMFRDANATPEGVVVSLDHARGLSTTDGEPVRGFAIRGEDGEWRWAEASIRGDAIVVSAAGRVTGVRYGWADNPDINVVNGAGLPMVPFEWMADE